jgi:chaperonin GroEL
MATIVRCNCGAGYKRIETKFLVPHTGDAVCGAALESWWKSTHAINAGEDGSVIVGKILEKDQYAYGFDSQTGEYGNLVAKSIIDPTKVGSDNPAPGWARDI